MWGAIISVCQQQSCSAPYCLTQQQSSHSESVFWATKDSCKAAQQHHYCQETLSRSEWSSLDNGHLASQVSKTRIRFPFLPQWSDKAGILQASRYHQPLCRSFQGFRPKQARPHSILYPSCFQLLPHVLRCKCSRGWTSSNTLISESHWWLKVPDRWVDFSECSVRRQPGVNELTW